MPAENCTGIGEICPIKYSLNRVSHPPTSHKGCSEFAPHQVCEGHSTAYKEFDDILH